MARKYRHELKYMISKKMAEVLKQRLGLIMDIDSNAENKDSTYHIRSLYFDDMHSTAYFEKLDGVKSRKKYRIRIYNHSSKFIRLECKYKHENMTLKDQVKITKNIALRLISNEIDDFTISDFNNKENYYHELSDTVCIAEDNLLKRFLVDMKINNLKPSVIVDYKRLAYTYDVSDTRVTFDEDVASGLYSNNLFDKDIQTYNIHNGDIMVVEVKFNEVLPQHIALILSDIPMFRQAVSKFAFSRSIK